MMRPVLCIVVVTRAGSLALVLYRKVWLGVARFELLFFLV